MQPGHSHAQKAFHQVNGERITNQVLAERIAGVTKLIGSRMDTIERAISEHQTAVTTRFMAMDKKVDEIRDDADKRKQWLMRGAFAIAGTLALEVLHIYLKVKS